MLPVSKECIPPALQKSMASRSASMKVKESTMKAAQWYIRRMMATPPAAVVQMPIPCMTVS